MTVIVTGVMAMTVTGVVIVTVVVKMSVLMAVSVESEGRWWLFERGSIGWGDPGRSIPEKHGVSYL